MSTWKEFERQLDDCDIQTFAKPLKFVVIRTDHVDHHVAACHVEDGKTLVIDIGQIIQEDR